MLSRNSWKSHHNAFRTIVAWKISLWRIIRRHKTCPGKNDVFKAEESRPLTNWSNTSIRTWWSAGIFQTRTHIIIDMNEPSWGTMILWLNNQKYWRYVSQYLSSLNSLAFISREAHHSWTDNIEGKNALVLESAVINTNPPWLGASQSPRCIIEVASLNSAFPLILYLNTKFMRFDVQWRIQTGL